MTTINEYTVLLACAEDLKALEQIYTAWKSDDHNAFASLDDMLAHQMSSVRTTLDMLKAIETPKPKRNAWLVENGKPKGNSLKYMTFAPLEGFVWTEDVHAALHFSRRKDAELVAQESSEARRIVEHGFCD